MICEFTPNEALILKEAIDTHFEGYRIEEKYHHALRCAKGKITRAIAHTNKMERKG